MSAASSNSGAVRAKVFVASTVALSFISFWRAAAIVLNDLGSSAFYAGGIAEQAAGRAAPWFILGVMLFSYAVRAVYVESCAMFTRGGVYRVVKEAMGGTLAKLSVSALIFDYILTGPISGVAAGQYIVGLAAQTATYFGHPWQPAPDRVDHLSALVAVAVTTYFWWRNTRGIQESSDDAMRIMKVTTVMVVLVIVWCGATLLVRGPRQLPLSPAPHNLVFDKDAVGWMPRVLPGAFRELPKAAPAESSGSGPHFGLVPNAGALLGLLALVIAFGHAVLAMSGEESLAQVNRELAHPKHKNLMRAGLVIFVYSLLFTSLVSFFASLLIPDAQRPSYFGNLISGLAMNVAGPLPLRLLFQGFVVVVGFLILSGAINTAMVGSNGVLNRMAEDGVLTGWFRAPHRTYGTTYRMINLVVLLQLGTIIGSRGNIVTLGNAYAFGVVWSFAFKGLAVLVLRYKDRSHREWKVPGNIRIRNVEIPLGLGLIAAVLFLVAIVNLFTKQDATIFGSIFTGVFFAIFSVSERINARRRTEPADLERFRLHCSETVTRDLVGVRPGNVLVAIRSYNTLEHLRAALERTDSHERDVVVMTTRLIQGADFAEELADEQNLLSEYEQHLFSRVVTLAEKMGKPVHLVVVPGTRPEDTVMLTAQRLQSSLVVLGRSPVVSARDKALQIGRSWERLPHPRPQLTLQVTGPEGDSASFLLGPHAPTLRPEDQELLHRIWLELTEEPNLSALRHDQILSVALRRLAAGLRSADDYPLRAELRRLVSSQSRPRR
jgi:amino acid transporter